MQKIQLKDLVISKQFRYEIKETAEFEIIAYDTETINGKCELLANSEDEHIFPKSIYDIFHFLCRKTTRHHIGFFYNLKYDFQAILKYLPYEFWQILYSTGTVVYDGWDIKYIPKKLLVITRKSGKKKLTWRFYDIAQYFRMPLDKASFEYLGKRKLYHPFNLKHLSWELIHTRLIIKYCKIDALRTKELAQKFIEICKQNGLYTKNYCSSASISARYFQQRIKYPTINRFLTGEESLKQLEYAWNCVSGAFISVYKKGYFENAFEYDINSAYPYHWSNFPDLNQGDFIFSNKKPKYATHGWIKVRFYIDPDSLYGYHPSFPVLRSNLPNYYPVGNFETFITLAEYNYFKGIYKIRIIDGLFWIPDKLEFPFKEIINEIYTKRKATEDDNINYFLKIVLNGGYGKFLEKYPIRDPENPNFGKLKTGPLFNPFIASYILAGTRIQVFDLMARQKNKNIIACFTDSVLFDCPVEMPRSEKLGDWDHASKGEALILGCGVYTIRGEKIKNKVRGFHLKNKKDYDMGFSFQEKEKPNNLFVLCEQYKDQDFLEIEITENLTPLKSLIQKIPNDMNLIYDKLKKVNINFDTKRIWDYYPKKAGELLDRQIDSFPIIHGL